MYTGGCPAPYPFPVSSMLGGGLSRSQESLLLESSHLSSSALSSSQSESPLQTKDLLMHWPDHKKGRHTKTKEGRRETLHGIERFCPNPQHYTHVLMWVWHKSSVCSGKDWRLFWSLFRNIQNWFWPWQDTKLKIEPESQFQAFSHKH